MLREALANLVDNALAHAPGGSTVTLRCRSTAAGGLIEVEDHGEGVAPEWRDRVFEPFTRVSEDRRPGSGLGLAIVRGIAERHGAVATLVAREDGPGTVARIQFR
jgi:signal transduction histidine kinase